MTLVCVCVCVWRAKQLTLKNTSFSLPTGNRLCVCGSAARVIELHLCVCSLTLPGSRRFNRSVGWLWKDEGSFLWGLCAAFSLVLCSRRWRRSSESIANWSSPRCRVGKSGVQNSNALNQAKSLTGDLRPVPWQGPKTEKLSQVCQVCDLWMKLYTLLCMACHDLMDPQPCLALYTRHIKPSKVKITMKYLEHIHVLGGETLSIHFPYPDTPWLFYWPRPQDKLIPIT